MQTFLPLPIFSESLKCLDYRRLGKQRVETYQILNILDKLKRNPNQKLAWQNHPAVKMWKNHEEALRYYYNLSLLYWIDRGYKSTMLFQDLHCFRFSDTSTEALLTRPKYFLHIFENIPDQFEYPSFVGDAEFHLSHQSNLVRKLPEHYRKFFPDVPDNLPYIWPRD